MPNLVAARALSPEQIRHQIKQRLSLRKPQAMSLDILADIVERMDLSDEATLANQLAVIQAQYPSVEDFEREFPSLCFALATGVGKTRLMGAMLAYLFLTGTSKNFFVLAPNTTIYEKLINDFSNQASSKYVFRGIAQFAQAPPIIVTGDTWQEGRGVQGSDLFDNAVINIFNVDKINKDKGKIKRLHEYIGQSYFEYLSELPDLVLFMDEAHRYRAKAGMKAVAELKPILGLEMTATPKSVGANSRDFKNVIFDYGLGNAMADGYVKDPAVATRADFRPQDYDADQLERVMLEDAVHCHEHTKAQLEVYARETGKPRVTPFILVVAQDTTHADNIRAKIDSEDFFGGRYRDRVATVHSNLKGEESDEAVQRLVSLETDHSTEIVIHVNKLKEGWDVTNLYTIVPLRASASDILTEQTLGRGLRLPYGERTGHADIDRLTVIAHDRFDAVIAKAKEPGSVVQMKEVIIGNGEGEISPEGSQVIEAPTKLDDMLRGKRRRGVEEAPTIFETKEAQTIAGAATELLKKKYSRTVSSGLSGLNDPKTREAFQNDLKRIVQEMPENRQGELEGVLEKTDVAAIANAVLDATINGYIGIPKIVIIPTRDVSFGFNQFELSNLNSIRKQPMSDNVLIRQLRGETQIQLARPLSASSEAKVEDYIVRYLIDYDQVDYDEHADLLYDLAGQMVNHLRSYLHADDDVENVALAHGRSLADFIFSQMMQPPNYWETPTDYQAKVTKGFTWMEPQSFATTPNRLVDFRKAVTPKSTTKSHVFEGFEKCIYSYQKFHSDDERRFAVLVDRDFETSIIRWVKPGPGQFQIEYMAGRDYEPDFVVETDSKKWIVEVKAANELVDEGVLAKSAAARKWVGYATEHAKSYADKPWGYAIVPHDQITEAVTFDGLMAVYEQA